MKKQTRRRALAAAGLAAAALAGPIPAAQADGGYGTAFVSAAATEKCAGLADRGSTANGTHLILWNCHGHDDQFWYGGRDYSDYSIRSMAGLISKCVGLANRGSTANGTPLVLWDCHGHPDQQWLFYRIDQTHYAIRNYASRKCVGLANRGSTANGTELVLWDCHFHPDQQWLFDQSPTAFGFKTS
jgi:hypothetical protein